VGDRRITATIHGVTIPDLDNSWNLALETSGAWGSVALGLGGEVRATRSLTAPRLYAAEFLPTIRDLCAESSVSPDEIRSVFISSGPGSFTGLRIGVTAARFIAMANDARLVAVPTLEVIAQNALRTESPPDDVAVVLDAKRGHVYAAWFQRAGELMVPRTAAAEVDPLVFLNSLPGSCAVLGEGVGYHRAAIAQSGKPILAETLWPPRAETVHALGFSRAALGQIVNRRDLIPVYIRPPDAEEKLAARANQSTSA